MFGRNGSEGLPRERPGFDTLIAKDVSIHGTIRSSGTLRIDGSVDGEIHTTGDLIVGEGGMVTARVQAGNVVVAGELHGNIEVSGRLHILPGGKLFGDAKVDTLVVEEGASFKGQCEMEVKQPGKKGDSRERITQRVDNTAALKGNPASSPVDGAVAAKSGQFSGA